MKPSGTLPMSQAQEESEDGSDDQAKDLDAHPVGAAQAARISGPLQLGVGARDHAALVAAARRRATGA